MPERYPRNYEKKKKREKKTNRSRHRRVENEEEKKLKQKKRKQRKRRRWRRRRRSEWQDEVGLRFVKLTRRATNLIYSPWEKPNWETVVLPSFYLVFRVFESSTTNATGNWLSPLFDRLIRVFTEFYRVSLIRVTFMEQSRSPRYLVTKWNYRPCFQRIPFYIFDWLFFFLLDRVEPNKNQ